jgi:small GTP-binding protein
MINNMSVEEQIREIEEELKKTPYNKATQKHIGKQKAKLAKLRAEQAKQSAGKGGLGYGIRKRGDATVLLVGFPSVGKSTLLNKLTAAESKIGEYEFTTLEVVPGVLEYKGAKIQVLDVPGLIEGASSGKGRGKEVLSVIRIADLVLFLADARKPEQAEIMKKELHQAGLRLDQSPPDIKVKKRERGGLSITMPKKMGID